MIGAFYSEVEKAISKVTSLPFQIVKRTPLRGGCISQAERLDGVRGHYFLKQNTESFLIHFEEEKAALEELRHVGPIRAPEPICSGSAEGRSYLVLEYIPVGQPTVGGWELLGQQLANLHKTALPHFGWHRDNTIGKTLQINTVSEDWISFFRENRLRFQMDLAKEKGFKLEHGSQLLENLPALFARYTPIPSLLHGDLWSGNTGFDTHGKPFVFDPCCYYGDRETDLAFTEFFGGFHPNFYAAYNRTFPLDPGYNRTFPLDPGYSRRKTVYNLYHCLNHFNLFGPPYDSQSQMMANQLLKLA